MAGTQLLENFLAVRGIVDDGFMLHLPVGPLLFSARLFKPFLRHESYQGFRRIQRDQTQLLHFGKGDQRLIGLKGASPVLTPSKLIQKILTGQIAPLDIPIQQGLTLPAEHFHGHDRPTTGLRKTIQDRQCGFDMKAIVMFFA